MSIRVTPLNLISSALLVSSVYVLIFRDVTGWRILGTAPLLALFAITFIADLIFRRFLKDIKRIWIVELLFIIFAVILILIIQSF